MSIFDNFKPKRQESIPVRREPERTIKYVYVAYFELEPNNFENMFLVTYDDKVFIEPFTQETFSHRRATSYTDDSVYTTYDGEEVEYVGHYTRLDQVVSGANKKIVAVALNEYLNQNREVMVNKVYRSMQKKSDARKMERQRLIESRQSAPQVSLSDRDEIMRKLLSLETGRQTPVSERDRAITKILNDGIKRR